MTKYRELLKLSTALKKEGKYTDACETLTKAFSSVNNGEYVDIHERLRLPVYLCFDDRIDEAWSELQRLYIEYKDYISRIAIISHMQMFSKDSGNVENTIFYFSMCYILKVMYYMDSIRKIHISSDEWHNDEPLRFKSNDGRCFEVDFKKLTANTKIQAVTKSGSPIYDVSHNDLLKKLNMMIDIDVMQDAFDDICKNLNILHLSECLVEKVISVIDSDNNECYDEILLSIKSFISENIKCIT
ncbi:hypothetical protein U0D24_15330 [Hafnia paralvei]|uniref:hypothetical protein n=1 Tax=Hafnia paralvei TaxID=546367 RepID=UPI002FDC11C9